MSFAQASLDVAPYDPHSDCDSEGNDPPTDVSYIDPHSADLIRAPPPRTDREIKLPFFQIGERRRLRENYEPALSYEDWVDESHGEDRQVKKLENDSDFPVGKPYFWHAFCPMCNQNFDSHVPGMWQCPQCKTKVWQQPDDPESKVCGVCKRKVAKIVTVGTAKIRNPMSVNAHMCKRCGRVVCDQCYSPVPQNLGEFGYNEPQRVCTTCVEDMKEIMPPEEEDLGTLHDEEEGALDEAETLLPFWPPKCTRCNTTHAQPPKRWACSSCQSMVWQPMEAQESTKCWICGAKFPKTRCHRCGQLCCASCGCYGEPLPELGWNDGLAKSVCKCCYGGISLSVVADEALVAQRNARFWKASCNGCGQTFPTPPEQWTTRCHKRKCWQPEKDPSSSFCAACSVAIAEGNREHCMMCGMLVCLSCAQYRQPVPERGFPKNLPQLVCKLCYHPLTGFIPNHTDSPFWPPKCNQCHRTFVAPPERWRCPAQCGNVWQPLDHLASRGCFCCGKPVSGGVNCRRCGRIVCNTCGNAREEVLDRGFTRGLMVPVCTKCVGQNKTSQNRRASMADRRSSFDRSMLASSMERFSERLSNKSFSEPPVAAPH